MQTALLLIDLQNDYFPGGKMELEGSIEASLKAEHLLSHFRQERLPIVHVQHLSTRSGATFFIPGTSGAEIHENLQPLEHEVVFQKHYPNSFRDTPLLKHLQQKEISRLVISGMMTHMCVDATTRAAFDYGFGCMVAHDACATRALVYQGTTIPARSVHLSFLAALQTVYAEVLAAEEILARLRSE
jgi:nicotinamidase-related amidase